MRICLVTNAHVSYNPRLLKEADALAAAGYAVSVVAIENDSLRGHDDVRLLESRSWPCVRIDFRKDSRAGFQRWAWSGIRRRGFSQLSCLGLQWGVAEGVFCRYLPETLRAALRSRAELYIAHNLQALPVAAEAARRGGALLGFDVEDFHLDEDAVGSVTPAILAVKEFLMEKYLGSCRHVSATTEAMANALVERFDIPRPVVLYNAFPVAQRNGLIPPSSRSLTGPPTAYWFSHVVSLDRGLQDFVRAMPLLAEPVSLHLRGGIHGDARTRLLELAARVGVPDRIHFHEPIHADDLVAAAARHDFGLALEQPVSRNRLLTATNKLFVYLLAGNAVIATDTPGQREVMAQAPGAGVLYPPGDHRALASAVNALLDRQALLRTRQAAWDAATNRFNWEVESGKLIRAISVLPRKAIPGT